MSAQVIDNPEVQYVFDTYPEPTREKLMGLRQLIFDVAAETEGVGTIQETLKWGQISYLTSQPKSGTTIRIDEYQRETEEVALFVHCQTNLVDTFRQMSPDSFRYEGSRVVIWDNLNELQIDLLKDFIELALTYHQRKRREKQ